MICMHRIEPWTWWSCVQNLLCTMQNDCHWLWTPYILQRGRKRQRNNIHWMLLIAYGSSSYRSNPCNPSKPSLYIYDGVRYIYIGVCAHIRVTLYQVRNRIKKQIITTNNPVLYPEFLCLLFRPFIYLST